MKTGRPFLQQMPPAQKFFGLVTRSSPTNVRGEEMCDEPKERLPRRLSSRRLQIKNSYYTKKEMEYKKLKELCDGFWQLFEQPNYIFVSQETYK